MPECPTCKGWQGPWPLVAVNISEMFTCTCSSASRAEASVVGPLREIEALVRAWITSCDLGNVLLSRDVDALVLVLHSAWEREHKQFIDAREIQISQAVQLGEALRRADAAEARVKELEQSMIGHFQREHLEGDGPEIDRWKARLAAFWCRNATILLNAALAAEDRRD